MSEALTAVAMSGGLDSSVAAMLLARSGEPVVGLSMLLWDKSQEAVDGRCCSSLDLGDAQRVAQQVGIPHYTLRMDDDFRRTVVDPFVDDYLAGRTPSPCVRCNTYVKFDLLLDRARGFGAQRVATGHYARRVRGDDGWELHRAVDGDKDQTYFLFELDQEQLATCHFPLGEFTKPQIRELAREAELAVAEKGESMETCFVTGGLSDFVESEARERSLLPLAPPEPALVVDREGRELGHGAPYFRYTVGQRRGLGVAAGKRLYVLEIDAESNRVVVGEEEELLTRTLQGERVSWVGWRPGEGEEVRATVKIRSRHPGVEGRIREVGGGGVEVEFAEAQKGVAPGQAAVFYDGDRVLGGCWISG